MDGRAEAAAPGWDSAVERVDKGAPEKENSSPLVDEEKVDLHQLYQTS
jgi:hypothetical protein